MPLAQWQQLYTNGQLWPRSHFTRRIIVAHALHLTTLHSANQTFHYHVSSIVPSVIQVLPIRHINLSCNAMISEAKCSACYKLIINEAKLHPIKLCLVKQTCYNKGSKFAAHWNHVFILYDKSHHHPHCITCAHSMINLASGDHTAPTVSSRLFQ